MKTKSLKWAGTLSIASLIVAGGAAVSVLAMRTDDAAVIPSGAPIAEPDTTAQLPGMLDVEAPPSDDSCVDRLNVTADALERRIDACSVSATAMSDLSKIAPAPIVHAPSDREATMCVGRLAQLPDAPVLDVPRSYASCVGQLPGTPASAGHHVVAREVPGDAASVVGEDAPIANASPMCLDVLHGTPDAVDHYALDECLLTLPAAGSVETRGGTADALERRVNHAGVDAQTDVGTADATWRV